MAAGVLTHPDSSLVKGPHSHGTVTFGLLVTGSNWTSLWLKLHEASPSGKDSPGANS